MADFMSLIEFIGIRKADYVVPPRTKGGSLLLADQGVKLRVRQDKEAAVVSVSDGIVMRTGLSVTADELRAFAVACLKVANAMEHGYD